MDTRSTEFFQDKKWSLGEFKRLLKNRFPNSCVQDIVEDIPDNPGKRFMNIVVPIEEKDNIDAFLDSYAAKRGAIIERFPRTTFPRGCE